MLRLALWLHKKFVSLRADGPARRKSISPPSPSANVSSKPKMKFVLIILFLFLANNSFSQRYSRNYASGLNALEASDTLLAKTFFLKCVNINKVSDTITYEELGSCFNLQEIFFSEKKFDTCLLYLKFPVGKRRVFRQMCQGGFGGISTLRSIFRESSCYYKLQLKDSAIKKLMPYIFITESPILEDSVEINSISDFFVSTIYELYGICKSKELFQKAIGEIKFSPEIKSSPIINLKTVDMNYVFSYLDCPVNLRGGTTYYLKDEDFKQLDSYRKWMWDKFITCKAYRLLME